MRLSVFCGVAAAGLLASLDVGAVAARIITECGNDAGVGYWFEGGPYYKGKSEWKDEEIKSARFSLTVDASGYDIISYDLQARSNVWSSRKLSKSIEFIRGFGADMVIVIGDLMVSTYVFKLDSSGYGEVAYSVSRANGSINKVSVLRAECRPSGKW
jgi:hypothetical protein